MNASVYSIYDVFISYRRRENDGRPQGTKIAEALYAYLTGKGLKVFLDRERMENGPFPEQLRWQVAHAPNYIFIATESAMRFRGGPGPDYVAEEVRLWDAQTLRETGRLQEITPLVRSAAFTPDGREIITVTAAGVICVWDAESGEYLRKIRHMPGLEVSGVDFRDIHPDSRLTGETIKYLLQYGAVV